jgi:hypothetical protein
MTRQAFRAATTLVVAAFASACNYTTHRSARDVDLIPANP